jgi:hypothetical protein
VSTNQEPNGAQTNPQEPVNASEKIRDEIRAMLGKGTDLSRQQTYSPILKDLATKYDVKYPVAKRAFDQVMIEGGQKEPKVAPTTKTVGDVEVEVKHRPKKVNQPDEEPKEETTEQPQPKKIFTPEDKDYLKRLFLSTFKSVGVGLFGVASKAWDVEIKPKTDEEYEQMADLWTDVCVAYGVEVPKIMVLLVALGYTGAAFALPIIGAATEAKQRKIKAEEKKKADEAKQVGHGSA